MAKTDLKKLTAKERALAMANAAQAKKVLSNSTSTSSIGSTQSAKERAVSIAKNVQAKRDAGEAWSQPSFTTKKSTTLNVLPNVTTPLAVQLTRPSVGTTPKIAEIPTVSVARQKAATQSYIDSVRNSPVESAFKSALTNKAPDLEKDAGVRFAAMLNRATTEQLEEMLAKTQDTAASLDAHSAEYEAIAQRGRQLKEVLINRKNEEFYADLAAKQAKMEEEALASAPSRPGAESVSDVVEQTKKGLVKPGNVFTGNTGARNIVRDIQLLTRQANGEEVLDEIGEDAKYLTDKQRDTLLYYAGMDQWDKASEYLSTIQRELNAKKAKEQMESWTAYAEEHPLAGAVGNVAASFVTPAAWLGNVVQMAKNTVTGTYEPVDTNSNWFEGTRLSAATREGVSKAAEIGKDIAGKDIGSFLAETGLSIGQFLSKVPLGPLALPYMGAGAAGEATYEALEGGATSEQAFLLGTASGLIETATEKIGLDNLFSIINNSGKQGVKAVLSQMLSEASEEAISEVANNLVDLAVMAKNSDFRQYVNSLVQGGMSRAQAEAMAFKQFFLVNTMWAAAGGALSGGVTGTGGVTAANVLGNLRQNGVTQTEQTAANSPDFSAESIMQQVVANGRQSAQKRNAPTFEPGRGQENVSGVQGITPAKRAALKIASEGEMGRQTKKFTVPIAEQSGAGYTEINTEGNANGGEKIYLRGSGQRTDGANPSGQVSAVEEGTGRTEGRETGRGPADSGTASFIYGAKVSAADFGIKGGSNVRNLRVVTGGDSVHTQEARQMAAERGLDLVLFAGGNLTLTDRNGENYEARAYIMGDKMYVRADHAQFTADQLTRHEIGHDMIAKGEIDPNTVRERIGVERADQLSRMYAEAYAGSDLTAEEIWEEVICDSVADMNIFTGEKTETDAAELLTETGMAAEHSDAVESRGPPAEGKASRENGYKPISQREWRMVQRERMSRYGEHLEEMPRFDYFHAHNMLYVVENLDETQFGAVEVIDPEKNQAKANIVLEVMKDGDIEYASEYRRRVENLRRWQRRNARDSGTIENARAGSGDAGTSAQNGETGNRDSTVGESSGTDEITYSSDYAHWRNVMKDGKASRETSTTAELTEEQQAAVSATQEAVRATVREELDRMGKEYGWIKAGESPARSVQIPKKTADDKKVSQTVRTVLEARATPEAAIPSIEEMVANGDFSYEVYGDEAAINDAEEYISNRGWGDAQREWFKAMEKGEVSKRNTTVGWTLYNNAVNSGDTEAAIDILNAMVEHQRNAAQALQATRILKKLSPETQLYAIQKSVDRLQQELNDRYGSKKGDAPQITIDPKLAEQLLNATNQQGRNEAMKEIYRSVGRQMPSRFIDKWNAWRYLSMLGNARTHVRNIVGNAAFTPVVTAKNLTATALESAVYRVSGGRTGRSKSVVTGFTKADRELLSAAWKDYATVEDAAMGGGKYNDGINTNKYIEEGRKVFGRAEQARTAPGRVVSATVGKAADAARKGNSKLLDVEDKWFSQPHYAAALASYCKANGLTPAQIKNGQGMDKARAYAMKEAQKATYRDTNALSTAISQMGKYEGKNPVKKGISTVMEGILPFRKTPANILARGLEYSPAGLLKSLSYDLYKVKQGTMTATEMIDNLSAGLTGTGLMALGVFLAAQGLIRGRGTGDEEEREFQELQGHQAYSLEVGDTSITLDWLAPECLPFFIGVNLWENTKGADEEVTMSSLLESIRTVTEPMLEMSCLQSLNDVFDAVGYASSEGLNGAVAAAASAATSYLTQGIPTLLGQFERSSQNERMTTYTEKNAFLTKDMQYAIGSASSRIPGFDYGQIAWVDAWGRTEDTGTVGNRLFSNMLNPAYISEIEISEMEEELLRLYEETDEAGVFPSRAAKYFTVNGERLDLSPSQYVAYAKAKGQKAYDMLTELTGSAAYKGLDSVAKVQAVELVYDYANALAKAKVSAYQAEGWIAEAQAAVKTTGISEAQYVTLYLTQKGISSLKNADGETISNSKGLQIMEMIYNAEGLTAKQRQQLFKDFDVGKSIIGYSQSEVQKALKEMRKNAG